MRLSPQPASIASLRAWLTLLQQFRRLAVQQADFEPLGPRLSRTILLDPSVGLVEPLLRLVGVPKPMMGHGQHEPVVRHAALTMSGNACIETLDSLLKPAGAVEGSSERVEHGVLVRFDLD